MEKIFAVCTPGLEPFAAQELHQLGLMDGDSSPRPETFPTESGVSYESGGYGSGGIEFQGSLHDAYRANLYLRTASRVLVRLGQFYAAEFPNSGGRRAVCFGKIILHRDDRSHYA